MVLISENAVLIILSLICLLRAPVLACDGDILLKIISILVKKLVVLVPILVKWLGIEYLVVVV